MESRSWKNLPPVIATNREGRESEEPLPHEVEELQRPPRADSPALVYKTHTPEGSEETKSDCHTAKPRVQ